MANLQKTTAPKFRRKNSCPDGWLHAGAKVPIRLTVRQRSIAARPSTSTGSATTSPS